MQSQNLGVHKYTFMVGKSDMKVHNQKSNRVSCWSMCGAPFLTQVISTLTKESAKQKQGL